MRCWKAWRKPFLQAIAAILDKPMCWDAAPEWWAAMVVVLVSVDVCASVRVREGRRRNWQYAYPMSFGVYFPYSDNKITSNVCQWIRVWTSRRTVEELHVQHLYTRRWAGQSVGWSQCPLCSPAPYSCSVAALSLGCVQTTSVDPSVSFRRALDRPQEPKASAGNTAGLTDLISEKHCVWK